MMLKNYIVILFVVLLTVSCNKTINTNVKKPNVIFVLADDLGYAELNSYGNTFNETPNLDKLANNGLRFTNAYVSAPVCSPSRASLMTGQHPARIGITDYLRPHEDRHLDENLTTVAEIFKSKDYQTGMVGKWHLSGYAKNGAKESGPDKHGFNEVILTEKRGISGGSYFYPYHFNQEVKQKIFPKEHLTDRVNLETIEFLERNNPKKTGKPFFLYKSHYSVHTNLNGKEEYVKEFSKKENAGLSPLSNKNNVHLAAQLKSVDDGIAMIVQKLEEMRELENTIIVFMSDNGGETNVTSNSPLRAGKSTVYEGGFRVPLIVSWKNGITQNRIVNEAVSCMDFFSTFSELLNFDIKKAQIQDGKSMLSLWKNKDIKSYASNKLFWHYPLEAPHFLGGFSSGAIREGDYKLVEDYTTKQAKLYNLKEDIKEQDDLSETKPKVKENLYKSLKKWRSDLSLVASGHTKIRKKQPKFPEPYGSKVELDINGKVVPWINYGVKKESDGTLVFEGKRNFLNLLHLYIPDVTAKSVEMSAVVEKECSNGVIIAHGEEVFGLAVYIKDDKLYFSTRKYGVLTSLKTKFSLSNKFSFKASLAKNGDLLLIVDGKEIARANIGESLPIPPDDPTTIGNDYRRLIGEYEAENYFKGKISKLKFLVK